LVFERGDYRVEGRVAVGCGHVKANLTVRTEPDVGVGSWIRIGLEGWDEVMGGGKETAGDRKLEVEDNGEDGVSGAPKPFRWQTVGSSGK
jgi:hypothetical protein